MTRYRVLLESESQPQRAIVSLDHLSEIEVHAEGEDLAARKAVAAHIDSRPAPPPAGTSFTVVVIEPPAEPGREAAVWRHTVSYCDVSATVH